MILLGSIMYIVRVLRAVSLVLLPLSVLCILLDQFLTKPNFLEVDPSLTFRSAERLCTRRPQ
jgi:hypothetical protein